MPGCHGTDQWTLDPPGQPRDKKMLGLNITVPKGRVFGGAKLRVGSVVESAGLGGVVSHGNQAKPTSAPGKGSGGGDGLACGAGQGFLKWEQSHGMVGGASGDGA